MSENLLIERSVVGWSHRRCDNQWRRDQPGSTWHRRRPLDRDIRQRRTGSRPRPS